MNWKATLVAIAVLTLFYLWRRAGQISLERVNEYLKNGGLVVDVRSRAEFNSGHLPHALNLPLDEIERAPTVLPQKDQPLLLHCQSGARSAVGTKRLRALGYTNVFNLGSYGRAAKTGSRA